MALNCPTFLNPKTWPNVSFLLNKKLTLALVFIIVLGPPFPVRSITVALVIWLSGAIRTE